MINLCMITMPDHYSNLCRPRQLSVGNGAETQAGTSPAPEATAQRSFPHAATPNAPQTPNGLCERGAGCGHREGSNEWVWSDMQEVELQGRRDQFQLEEVRQRQLLEKRQLPKRLKADHKQKIAEARKALRNKKADKESLKKLDEQYIKICQLETELMNEAHEKEMETLRAELEANMRELREIQVSPVSSHPLTPLISFPSLSSPSLPLTSLPSLSSPLTSLPPPLSSPNCRMRRRCS